MYNESQAINTGWHLPLVGHTHTHGPGLLVHTERDKEGEIERKERESERKERGERGGERE